MPGHQAARLRIKSITYAFCLSIDEWQKRHNSLFYLNLLCHSPAWLLEIQPHSLLVFFAHHSNPEQVISNPLFVLPWSQILILWWLLADRHMEGVCVFARIKGFVPWPQAWTVILCLVLSILSVWTHHSTCHLSTSQQALRIHPSAHVPN